MLLGAHVKVETFIQVEEHWPVKARSLPHCNHDDELVAHDRRVKSFAGSKALSERLWKLIKLLESVSGNAIKNLHTSVLGDDRQQVW